MKSISENKILVNKELVEVLRVWYSLFCTFMDQEDLSDESKLKALKKLRQELKDRLPQVEETIKKGNKQ